MVRLAGMIFCFDEYELDAGKLELRRNSEPVKADPAVLRLLAALVRDAGQLVTKAELIERVWDGRAVSENVISVAMARLRKVLRDPSSDREFVVNLHGRGYRFVRPVKQLDRGLAPLLDHRSAPITEAAVGARRNLAFVGRETVMQRLRSALREASTGAGNVCFLTGEPGIGKSRVAEQLAMEATALRLPVAWGYCHEAGDTPPLWPWAQLARSLLSTVSNGNEGVRAAAQAPELEWLLPADRPSHGDRSGPSDRPLAKHRVFDAILSVFEAVARATPCVLVLEDLHRADAATLELLRYWIDPIARINVLLLATLRPAESREALASADLSYVVGHRNCSRVELQRLRKEEVAAYVATLLEDRDGRLAQAVFTKSEGNPFFMAELGRQLAASARPEPDSLTVPQAALELIRPRVLALDLACNGVLSAAAVIGRSFKLRLLAAVTGAELNELMVPLDRALEHEVVLVAPDSRTAFTFSHDLLRAVLYDNLPPVERRSLHLKVALALEEQRRAGESVTAAVLAYHFHAALPESDLRKTVEHCLRAADDAGTVFAYADGVRYLYHALEALALTEHPSARLRMSLLLRQAIYARITGLPEFDSLTRELIRTAREQRDGAMMAHAAMLLNLHTGMPALPGAHSAMDDALALLSPDDIEIRGTVLARLSTCAPLAFDARASRAQFEQALELGRRCGSALTLCWAWTAQLYLCGGPAHAEEEARALRELDQLCREHPHQLSVPPVRHELHRAIRALQSGDLHELEAALSRAAERCRELGSRELMWHVERCQALAQINVGARKEGESALRALHRLARESAILGSELLCLHDEIIVFAVEEPTSLPRMRATLAADRRDAPNVWSIKIRALAAAGLHEEARALLHAISPAQLADLPCDRDYLGTLAALSRAALALGELDYAAVAHTLLAPYSALFCANVGFLCEGSAAEILGELAWALGRRSEAVSQLEAAVEYSRRAGLRAAAESARRALHARRAAISS
jgi:DNA-binding winged helix-turn-helix (wHTH) protein